MTPMDDNELRRELAAYEPTLDTPDDALSRGAIQRGRQTMRRRTAIGVVAAVVLVAVGAGLALQFLPARDVVPAEPPSPTPVPSETQSAPPEESTEPTTESSPPEQSESVTPPPPSPSTTETVEGIPRWDKTDRLPGEFGDTLIAPLHWEGGAEGDQSAWKVDDEFVLRCGEEVLDVQSLAAATGGKTIVSEGPETGLNEAVVEFAEMTEAQAFLEELQRLATECAAKEPVARESDDPESPTLRTRMAVHPLPELGDEADGFAWTTWEEAQLEEGDDFVEFPGGTITAWARNGQVVTMAGNGGEYIGDPMPDALPELQPALDHVLPNR